MLRKLFKWPTRTRADIDTDMRDEIDAHIAIGVDHLVARGANRADAERQVRARFGDLNVRLPEIVASARRRSRKAGRRERARDFLRDLAFAARQLRRSPALTLGVVLSLAFGIGATATVYSWMQGMVLRPFPAIPNAQELIGLRADARNGFGVSVDEFREWRGQMKSVSGVAAVSLALFAAKTDSGRSTGGGLPIYGIFVSGNYFDVLGVPAAMGRTFNASDDMEGASPVAVISDVAWKQRFSEAPDIVGRSIELNGRRTTIIGVAARRFGGNFSMARLDIWVPLSTRPLLHASEAGTWRQRDNRWLDVIARVPPGSSVALADAEIRAISQRQALTFPEDRGRGAHAELMDVFAANQLEALFIALLSVTALVVLVICSNVANLLLARAAARHRELALRRSLGASRGRIIAQLMTESSLLAALGAGLGVLVAMAGQIPLATMMPPSSLPVEVQTPMDWHFVAVVIGVTCACVLAFGLGPALIGSRIDVVSALRNGARGSSATRSRMRAVLVVVQFAFALSVLVCSSLFVRRDQLVRSMDLGFRDGEHVLLMQTEISLAGYGDLSRWGRTIESAVARVASMRGVRSATVASFVPLGIVGWPRHTVVVPSHPTEIGAEDRALVNAIGPEYFALMGIPLLHGRGVADTDTPDRVPVAVVNAAFADKYFGGSAALGRTFAVDGRDLTIVGIAANGRYDYHDIDNADMPLVYTAWRQAPQALASIHVRTDGDPLVMSSAIRDAIHEIDPALPLLAPMTLKEYSSVPFYGSRGSVKVLGVLSTVALLLASMGLFSVISYGVSLRTLEIGIRMALGATPGSVARIFTFAAGRLVSYGLACGAITAFLMVALVRNRIPLLQAAALREYVIPAVVLTACAIAAGFVPARRAAAVDPATSLRAE